jgi:CheY-like chemotaxis protein
MSTTPTVYFIDDSATMREVIKIAFRRENINVLACHDGATALAQMEQTRPDVVISDVIMPDKDGYEVCQHIKQHPTLSKTPVILMSGVVNRAVAEKAFAVKADELIRKPFQPQDLITRVRHLLEPKGAPAAPVPQAAAAASASAALSSIFSAAPGAAFAQRPAAPPAVRPAAPAATPSAPRAPLAPPAVPAATATSNGASLPPRPAAAPPARPAVTGLDVQKMKIEILRLEGLVRKLQSELQAEREYARALEEHIKTLQEAE